MEPRAPSNQIPLEFKKTELEFLKTAKENHKKVK